MQSMITLLLHLRRQPSRHESGRTDARSGVPAHRELAPMPRMRWYS
jgi:hypothetical protein